MKTLPDYQLLRQYVDHGSEAAFSELVARYTALVYASAVRQVIDPHTAEDVVQLVFLTLARRAGSIRPQVPLSGWLLQCTRYLVLCLKKARSRRQKHERRAVEMAEDARGSRGSRDPHETGGGPEHPWASLSPLLDESLAGLSEKLRAAVVLRFFEGLSFEQTAQRLGISSASARQRVSRGVALMRGFFARRGVAVSEAALTASVLAHAVPPLPHGLPIPIAAAIHLTPSAARLAATKGALGFMAWTKTQTLIAGAAGLLLLGGATAVTLRVVRGTPREVVIDPAARTSSAPRTGSLLKEIDTAVARQTAQTAPATLPADWRSQFESAYGLAADQAIKHVGPPFVAGRQAFYGEEQRQQGMSKAPPLFPTESLVIAWDGGTPHWAVSSLDGGTLDDALWFCAQLRPWDLDKSVPRTLKLPGDFAVRKGATADQVMRGLGPIVSEALRRPVHFEKRRVPREAVVVRGNYHYTPLDGESDDGVINFAPHYPAKVAVKRGTLGQMLHQIRDQIDTRVFDETGESSQPVRWRHDDRWVSPAKLLADVARQTSLSITREPRDADVWFMVDGPQ